MSTLRRMRRLSPFVVGAIILALVTGGLQLGSAEAADCETYTIRADNGIEIPVLSTQKYTSSSGGNKARLVERVVSSLGVTASSVSVTDTNGSGRVDRNDVATVCPTSGGTPVPAQASSERGATPPVTGAPALSPCVINTDDWLGDGVWRYVSQGTCGRKVELVQEGLRRWGYDVGTDGVYGRQTAGFVASFKTQCYGSGSGSSILRSEFDLMIRHMNDVERCPDMGELVDHENAPVPGESDDGSEVRSDSDSGCGQMEYSLDNLSCDGSKDSVTGAVVETYSNPGKSFICSVKAMFGGGCKH